MITICEEEKHMHGIAYLNFKMSNYEEGINYYKLMFDEILQEKIDINDRPKRH